MKHRFPKLGQFIALVALSVSGCHPNSSVGKSTLTETVAGRKVVAEIDGPGFISSENDKAIVSFNSHKVRVEKDRALLDEAEVAKIPADATEVEVTVKDGGLSISADGTPIANQRLK